MKYYNVFFWNLNDEIEYKFNNQSKKYPSRNYYSQLHSIVELFESSMWNDFTEKELKFKTYIYDNKINSAYWPKSLVKDLIKVFEIKNKVVLDPFMGSGTIGVEAIKNKCFFYGYEKTTEGIQLFLKQLKNKNI